MKSGNLNFLEPSGPLQTCNETALPAFNIIHPSLSRSFVQPLFFILSHRKPVRLLSMRVILPARLIHLDWIIRAICVEGCESWICSIRSLLKPPVISYPLDLHISRYILPFRPTHLPHHRAFKQPRNISLLFITCNLLGQIFQIMNTQMALPFIL
jgi:hypothetical protein